MFRPWLNTCLLLAVFTCVSTADPAWAAQLSAPVSTRVDAGSSDPRVSLGPTRFDTYDAEPGDVLTYELRARNTTDDPVRLSTGALALEGSTNPREFARVGGRSSRSAELVDWVRYPGFEPGRVLAPGEELRIPVAIDVPADPPPGTFALGLSISWTVVPIGVDTDTAPAGRVRLDPTLASVAIIRLPGEAVAEARLGPIDAPRVIWLDRSASFGVRVENTGDTDLVIDGEVDLNSFVGTASRTLDASGPDAGQPALPGGVRDVSMRWGDPPLLGWFTPELVVVGGTGSDVRITKQLETVYVLPPWWLLLLLVVAITGPLWAMRRRRRDPDHRDHRRTRARARVEQRMRQREARRRAEAARRGWR